VDQPQGANHSGAEGQFTLEVAHGIEPLAPEWDALVDRIHTPPFLRPGWIDAWWRAFGSGSLEIFLLRQGGRLVGLLPLCRWRGALFSPTNWHTPAFGLVAEPNVGAEFVQEIFLNREGARRLSLAFIDPSRDDLGAWRASAEKERFRVLTRILAGWSYVEIEGDWEAYQNSLSRNFRSDVRRCLRRLREAGTVTFEIQDGRERLESSLAEGFAVESAGWKAARRTAITARPETERFYREVGAWAAAKSWLRLAFLRLDGRALAFEFAIEEGGVYYALKSGYDPEYRAFSPGKLLIHQTLEQAFTLGLARYELGVAEKYKSSWANAFRKLVRFQAFAPSPAGLVDWAAFRYAQPLMGRTLAAVRARRARA
jgi:CelD/BcsL family acetyltransferase involved in cellulose biosynthesis